MKVWSLFQLWPLNSDNQAYILWEIGEFFFKEVEWPQEKYLQIKNNSGHSISEKRANDSWEGLGKELASYNNTSTVSLLTSEV